MYAAMHEHVSDPAAPATAEPDLTGLQSIEPDDAATRVRYVCSRFGTDVLWTARATGHQAKWEWPPDIWSSMATSSISRSGS